MSTLNGMGLRTVEAKTANYSWVAGEDTGKTLTNEGASGAVTIALPPATVGEWGRLKLKAAQEFRLDPNGTETIALPSTGVIQAAGAYLVADAVGEGLEFECVKAGTWDINYYTGTWTAV